MNTHTLHFHIKLKQNTTPPYVKVRIINVLKRNKFFGREDSCGRKLKKNSAEAAEK